MKLIYLANIRIPTEKAHGLQIMKMCEAFASNGADVELIVPRRDNEIKEDPFGFYGVKKIFKITRLSCVDQIKLKFLPESAAFVIQTISFYASAKIYLFSQKYGILYSRESKAALLFPGAVLELHSLPPRIGFFNRIIYKRAVKIVALTGFIKKKLIASGVDREIISEGDAVDLELFDKIIHSKEEIRNEFALPADKKIFAYVGKYKTMGMDKGVGMFISAYSRVIKENKNCFLLLVGINKDEVSEIAGLAGSLGMPEDGYKIVLHVPQIQAFELMKVSDLLVMAYPNTTHYAFYMSPMKLFEYMASGSPILSTDLPSVREVLNENNSILVPSDSEKGLQKGLEYFLDNPEKAAQLAAKARQDVGYYTWNNRAQRIIKFIGI